MAGLVWSASRWTNWNGSGRKGYIAAVNTWFPITIEVKLFYFFEEELWRFKPFVLLIFGWGIAVLLVCLMAPTALEARVDPSGQIIILNVSKYLNGKYSFVNIDYMGMNVEILV